MPTAAIIGSSIIGAAGSAYAANKQSSATNKAIKANNAMLGPYAQFGTNWMKPMEHFLSEGADFADTQAYKDIVNSSKAGGQYLSGNRATALTDYYATNFRPQRMNELFSALRLGANAAAGQATNATDLYQAKGAIQGAGAAGIANSFSSGLNNLAFLNMYNQQNPGGFNGGFGAPVNYGIGGLTPYPPASTQPFGTFSTGFKKYGG